MASETLQWLKMTTTVAMTKHTTGRETQQYKMLYKFPLLNFPFKW